MIDPKLMEAAMPPRKKKAAEEVDEMEDSVDIEKLAVEAFPEQRVNLSALKALIDELRKR